MSNVTPILATIVGFALVITIALVTYRIRAKAAARENQLSNHLQIIMDAQQFEAEKGKWKETIITG